MESSATPPPAALPPAPQLPSPRSGLDSFLHQLPGSAVVAWALWLIRPTYLDSAGDRWKWGLLCSVGLVVPTLAWNVFDRLSRSLAKPRT